MINTEFGKRPSLSDIRQRALANRKLQPNDDAAYDLPEANRRVLEENYEVLYPQILLAMESVENVYSGATPS